MMILEGRHTDKTICFGQWSYQYRPVPDQPGAWYPATILAEVRPGMAAELEFRFASPGDAAVFRVPAHAVAEDRAGRFVFVVEPSGAATLAALLSGRVPLAAGGETCAVLSGGNLDPTLCRSWLGTAS